MGMSDVKEKTKSFGTINPKERCKLKCIGSARHDWKRKDASGNVDESLGKTLAMKLELQIDDPDIELSEPDTIPGRITDYLISLEKHPGYKNGEPSMSAPNKAFQLEGMLGFEPFYVDDSDTPVPAETTRTGKPKAPKGSHRKFNPSFIEAYFTKGEDGNEEPKFGVWESAEFYAEIEIEEGSEEYGNKNSIKKYLKKE